MAKYKVVVNSIDNVRDLLQEAYLLSDEQLVQAQNEINKLANSTNLQDEIMDAKQKYCKAINDYLSIKDKAISKKLEIAKLLAEIMKHNGDIEGTINDEKAMKSMDFDFSKIKKMIDDQNKKDKTEVLSIKKDS